MVAWSDLVSYARTHVRTGVYVACRRLSLLVLLVRSICCLLFSLSGRFLLGFALKGALDQSLRGSVPQKAEGSLEQKTSLLEQEKLTAERMTESVANPKKSIVEAKV